MLYRRKHDWKYCLNAITKQIGNSEKTIAGDEIGITSYNAQTGYANALILVNTDGVISHIVVETSGEGEIWG